MITQTKIPAGWKQAKLGDIGKVSMCKRIFKYETLPKGSIPFYKISTFGKKADSFISKEIFEEYIKKYPYPKKGEILISASGTIGRIVVFNGEESYFQDSNIVWISNPQNKVSNNFLKHVYLKTRWKSTDGGIISRLYNEDLRAIKFSLPSLPEQEKIVEVLEAWDSYLEKLIHLIKLKKKIVKGLMQKLLNGKIRLNGFNEQWREIKLGEISQIISGGTPSTKIEAYWNGEIPWISSSDLVINNIRHINIHRYISREAIEESATKIVSENSILVVSRVGVGKIAVNTMPLCTSQDFQSIINSKNLFNPHFLAGLLSIEIQKFLQVNQGSFIKGFLKSDLENLVLKLPSIAEQIVIANILTTADREIEALEKKKTLVEQQKKFLLNNLITGRIRLPEFAEASKH